MSLQIVAGSSGAGKSYTVYRELIGESMRHPEQNFIVMVPEQFTMQTQKDLVMMHPRRGLLNVDVLSFNRLAWRVFGEVGGNTGAVIDDIGKTLVLQKTISSCEKSLGVLRGTLSRQGSVENMKSLISELLQYRVTPDDLGRWLEKNGKETGLLPEKISDVRTIYESFLDTLSSNYLTVEEVPQRLADVIDGSELVSGSTVVLDGFTGFTPVQLLVVERMLAICRKVTVIVTADSRTDLMGNCGKHRLFYMSCRMTRQLTQLANQTGCEILPVRKIEGNARFSDNPPMRFLEQNILRYHHEAWKGEQDRIHLCSCPDPREEVRIAVSAICRMVRRQGYRWRDFAVVTGDLDTYGREFDRQLTEENIPHFLDQKKSLLANPLVEFIRSAVGMIVRGFSYESVFRFLRCSLTDFTADEIDRMENYVLGVGVRGWKNYTERWIRVPAHMAPGELDELNELRERFRLLLGDFTEGMRQRNGTIRRKTEVLYRFLVKNDLQQKISDIADDFEAGGDASAAREYRQIYSLVMNLFDQMVSILGDERMGNAAYLKMLEAGLSESSVGLIPPGEDQVMIGDITRTRLKKIRVMFVVGVNEGVVPKAAKQEGILSEADRASLAADEIRLAPGTREELASQRFYLYLILTKASDFLFLSWSRMDAGGKAKEPSYLMESVRSLFPEMKIETEMDRGSYDRLETSEGRLQVLLSGIRGAGAGKDDPVFLAAAQEDPETFFHLMAAAQTRNPTEGIGKKTARALYGNHLRNSASRLETFAACAFRHYLEYGLRLSERDEYIFTPADLGTIMHNALARFSERMAEERVPWNALTEEMRNQYAEEALSEIVHDYGNTILHSSARNTYEIRRIERILKKTVWVLQEQMGYGSFVTENAEQSFVSEDLESLRIRAGEDTDCTLTGRIDRVDICDQGSERFIKIIDYKTGKTSIDFTRLYHGLQIQLMIYLNAAMESEQRSHPEKKILPAGLFYYNVDDPYIDAGKAGNREQEILKEQRMKGLALADSRVLSLMDRSLDETGKSAVITGISINDDGNFKKGSNVLSAEDFRALSSYVRRKSADLVRRMQEGETAASPYLSKDSDACSWCPYHGVCGFDERIPGYRHRRLKSMSAADLLEKIREEK